MFPEFKKRGGELIEILDQQSTLKWVHGGWSQCNLIHYFANEMVAD